MQRLSSYTTFFYKLILPLACSGIFCVGTIGAWLGLLGRTYSWLECVLFTIGAIVGGLAMKRYCIPLKEVWLAEDSLIVSNYLKTIQIPLTHIESVAIEIYQRPKAISVTLKVPSRFGTSFLFIPSQGLWRSYLTPEAVCGKLNAAVNDRIEVFTSVVSGHYPGGMFIPDGPLPDADGTTQLVITPTTLSQRRSIAETFGKAKTLRSTEEILSQVQELRDEWGDR